MQEAQLPIALSSALQTTAFPTVVGGFGPCPSRSEPAISWKSVTDPGFASYLFPQGSVLQVGPLGGSGGAAQARPGPALQTPEAWATFLPCCPRKFQRTRCSDGTGSASYF